jgi:hypothetical protein
MKRLIGLKYSLLAFILAMPVLVSAQNSVIQVPNVGLPGRPTDNVADLMVDIIQNILLPIAGIVAVLFIIVGGFQYMLAGANEDLAKKGKSTLTNAIIGLIIIILSYVIVTVVVNTLM